MSDSNPFTWFKNLFSDERPPQYVPVPIEIVEPPKGVSNVELTGRKNGELLEGKIKTADTLQWWPEEEWRHIDERYGKEQPNSFLERDKNGKPTGKVLEEHTDKLTEMDKLKGMDLRKVEVPDLDEDGGGRVDENGKPVTKLVDLGNFEVGKMAPVRVMKTTGEDDEIQLAAERRSLRELRGRMTDTINGRVLAKPKTKEPTDTTVPNYEEQKKQFDLEVQSISTVKKGVENHCDMATKLTSLLEPGEDFTEDQLQELFKKDEGLLCRIQGTVEGQGGFATPNPKEVIATITKAAENIKNGKGTDDDGNKVTQFVAAFVDGLTEVTEGKVTAKKQFDQFWKRFATAFGLEDEDKDKLLKRVEGYKKIASGLADTQSGKGGRKDATRLGLMPNDSSYKIKDENALIKGDISGSMHSQLLAQEFSESLVGGKGIKGEGEPVQVLNKALLNVRAHDALLMTAGGSTNGAGDLVFHTAYEMINGMQKITGCPEVSQEQAMIIVNMMRRGKDFSDVMEDLFPPTSLPAWV